MGGKKEINHGFGEMLRGKRIPLLVLDQKWHHLFEGEGKPKKVVKLEKKENEYLRRQGKLNQDVKELKNLKEKLLKNIMANMEEIEEEKESRKLKEDRRLISEINEKLRTAIEELEELPQKLDAVNEALMEETMEFCYVKMRANKAEIDAIRTWIEQIREEAKQKAAHKQTVEDRNREIYSYMHDIFGASIIEIFDLKYQKASSGEEEEKRQS